MTQRLVDAYLAGATVRGLARDLDMHRATIHNCLERAGVRRPRLPLLSEAQLDEVEAAYLAGESCVTIATRFKVSAGTIGNGLKQRGVAMRPRRGGIRNALLH